MGDCHLSPKKHRSLRNANHYVLKAIIYEKMGKNDAAKRCREKAATLGSFNENPGL